MTGLVAALSQSEAVVFSEARLRLPGWTANLGGFDVAVAGPEGSVVLIETKWGEVWQGLWDVLKLASAWQHPRVTAAYAVYAGTAKEWARYDEVRLFADWDKRSFVTDAVLEDYAKVWNWNLKGTTVYPSEVPTGVDLEAIAREEANLMGTTYEFRVVAVSAVAAKALKLEQGRLTG